MVKTDKSKKKAKKNLRSKEELDAVKTRAEYIRLDRELNSAENNDADQEQDLQVYLKKMDQNYTKVKRAREAVVDAEIFRKVSAVGAKQAERMLAQKICSREDFITTIKERYGALNNSGNHGKIDWVALGAVACRVLDQTPRQCTVYGPMRREITIRKKANRKALSSKRATTFKTAKEDDGTTDGVDKINTEGAQSIYRKVLRTESYSPTDMYNVVTNPYSFSQTVENMFHLSILVKEGRSKIIHGDDGSLKVVPHDPRENREDIAHMPANHCIVRIDSKMIQKMVQQQKLAEQGTHIPVRNSDDLSQEWFASQQYASQAPDEQAQFTQTQEN